MGILNYTSEVPAAKTIGQLYEIIAQSGAHEISFEHKDGDAVALKFCIMHAEKPLWFRIKPNPAGVLSSMERDKVPPRYQNDKQAHRTAWRILKDAVEAQLAIFQSEQGDLAEVFLPYAIDSTGTSFYEIFTEGRQKSLTA